MALLLAVSFVGCDTPPPPPMLPCRADKLAAGDHRTWVVESDGTAWAWGSGTEFPATGKPWGPTREGSLADVVEMSARSDENCFLTSANALRCGAVWPTDPLAASAPSVDGISTFAMGLSTIDYPSDGPHVVCAAKSHGSVACWRLGRNQILDTAVVAVPEQEVTLDAGVSKLAVGLNSRCAIDLDGSCWCWGWDYLGDGTYYSPLDYPIQQPRQVVLPAPAVSISAESAETCVALDDGSVYCWGRGYGLSPTKMDVEGVTMLSSGRDHTCAVDNTGNVWCWGYNNQGQLGRGAIGTPGVPGASVLPLMVVAFAGDVTAVSAGDYHTCARRNDASVWCWGYNGDGQLGNPQAHGPGSPTVPLPALGCQ